MAKDGDDLVGHFVHVPEVDLQDVPEHLGHTRLLRDDHGHVVGERFERGEAERLGDRRHDIEVGHAKDPVDVLAAQEAGEQHLVPDAHLGGQLDRPANHVAAAGHDEAYVVHDFEHLLGRGQEVLRPLLHRDPSEEQDDLLVTADGRHRSVVAAAVGVDAVVDHLDLVGIDVVARGQNVLGQIADRDDAGRGVESGPLDVVDALMDVLAAAVKLGGVNVYYERLARQLGHGHPRRVGHPVVCVDHFERFVASEHRGQAGVVLNFAEHVAAVLARAHAETADRVDVALAPSHQDLLTGVLGNALGTRPRVG